MEAYKQQINKDDFSTIITCLCKAPSGHNTQPWILIRDQDSIMIKADMGKTLNIVDPVHRELFISLGAAIENAIQAANALGFDAIFSLEKNSGNWQYRIKLIANSDRGKNNTQIETILQRQTNRSIYLKDDLPVQWDNAVRLLADKDQLAFITRGTPSFEHINQLILKGNTLQMNNKAFLQELIGWMRFNQREIKKFSNGLTYQCIGMPSLPRFLGKGIMQWGLSSKKMNKLELKKLNSSQAFLVISSEKDSALDWIDTGRLVEKILLHFTREDIAYAFENQPCEIATLRQQLKEKIATSGQPQMIIRIGRAPKVPYSPRQEKECPILE